MTGLKRFRSDLRGTMVDWFHPQTGVITATEGPFPSPDHAAKVVGEESPPYLFVLANRGRAAADAAADEQASE